MFNYKLSVTQFYKNDTQQIRFWKEVDLEIHKVSLKDFFQDI